MTAWDGNVGQVDRSNFRHFLWDFKYGFLSRTRTRILQNKRVRRFRFRLRRVVTKVKDDVRRRKSSIKRRCLPLTNRILQVRIPKTPCPHLLRSNEPPTESEYSIIQSAIEDAQARIDSLTTTKMSASRTTKATLQQLHQFVRDHKATLSLIRSLPFEIIQLILKAVFDDIVKSSWNPLYQRHCPLPPWHLGHICGPWRRAAISMFGLWSTIFVELETRVRPKRTAPLKEILSRTHGAPLRLTLCSPPSSKTIGFSAANHPLLALLLEHAEQWGDVMFLMCTGTLASLAAARGRLHALHTIWLVFKNWPLKEEPDVVDFLASAPRLTSVTISVFGTSQTNVVLPWAQLESFTHTRSNPSVLRRHLPTLSPSLKRLTLTLTSRVACPEMFFPSLRELRLKAPYGQSEDPSMWLEGKLMLTDLLCHIIAPSLKTLQLEFDSCPNSEIFDSQLISSLTTFVTHGPPDTLQYTSSLQKLSIKIDHRTSRALPFLRFLHHTPRLTHLIVDQISQEDLCRLGQGDQETYLPALRQLTVRLVVGWDTEANAGLVVGYIKAIYDTRCRDSLVPSTPSDSTTMSTATGLSSPVLCSKRRAPRKRIDVESPRQHQSTSMWKLLEAWDETPTLIGLVELKDELCGQFPGSLTGNGVPRVRTSHVFDALNRYQEDHPQGQEWYAKTESILMRLEELVDLGNVTYRDVFASQIYFFAITYGRYYDQRLNLLTSSSERAQRLIQSMRNVATKLEAICANSVKDYTWIPLLNLNSSGVRCFSHEKDRAAYFSR